VRLHRGVDLALGSVRALDDDLRLGEAGGEVATLADLRLAGEVAAVLDRRRLRCEGRRVVDDEWQLLVTNLDGPDGVDRLVRRFGGDRRDLLALVAALVVEELARKGPAALVPRDVGARCPTGDHRPDAGHLLGLAGVDGEDPRVGVGTAQDGAVQHPR